jgi:hypothetical protein
MARSRFACAGAIAFILLFSAFVSAQQQYVGRYDAFGSFSYLTTSSLNLNQRGYNSEFGYNVRRWVAFGGDFSVFTGRTNLLPTELSPTVQAKLAPLAPLLPPGYKLYVPINSTTYTYSLGPQINIRKLKPIMFFIRPALGAMHQAVIARPSDPIQSGVVASLVPGGRKSDTVPFYGVGGGFDARVSDHFAIRVGVDFVHTSLFESLLKQSQNSVRISVGPAIRWGSNVAK